MCIGRRVCKEVRVIKLEQAWRRKRWLFMSMLDSGSKNDRG